MSERENGGRGAERGAGRGPAQAGARLAGGMATLVLLAVLTGCASAPRLVETEVTSYDEWSTLPADRSYAFARTLEFQNSLELKAYEDIVGDELALQGFHRAVDGAAANLMVTLRPSVTTTRVRMASPWPMDPFWTPFGFYGRRGFGGFGGYGGYGSFGGYDPSWSMGGIGGDATNLYQRRLELDIDARTEVGKRYYEGRVENSGETDSLRDVMPSMIRALFNEFPGNSGQTRRVAVPLEPRPER